MTVRIPSTFTAGKSVAVLGLGKSGRSVIAALRQSGIDYSAWDDNADARDHATQEGVRLQDPTTLDWGQIAYLIISPGIAHTHPTPHPAAVAARVASVPLICDVEILLRQTGGAKIIAISGTNGKSTTTALIGHILKEAGFPVSVGGNLGRPALDLDVLPADGCYVLELSSYQLELTPSLQPDVAVLLNITPDHLARHGGMDGYIAAKAHLFAHQQPGNVAIIGHDDDICVNMARTLKRQAAHPQVIAISGGSVLRNGVFATGEAVFDAMDGNWLPIMSRGQAPRLPGSHNGQNIAAAYAACRSVGVPVAKIVAGIASFAGLPHRMEQVGEIPGIRFINDSKATNADAAARALVCYDRIYWILGGRAKETGLQGLEPFFPRVAHAYLIGEAAADFGQTLAHHGVQATSCGQLDRAVAAAYADAQRDPADQKVILLSPACASWDQFKNFEERGDLFRSTVQAMLRGSPAGKVA